MTEQHTVTEDGESTERWACREPGFFGSVRQLTCCARCGCDLPHGRDHAHRYRDVFKPTMHVVCDPCHDALPE